MGARADLTKYVLLLGALWVADDIRHAIAVGDNFDSCHQTALQVTVVEKFAPWQLLLPPLLNTHDQIDELIQRCMLARGYDYTPSAWARCPTEKIGVCYSKPSWATKAYREIRDLM